MEGSCIQTRGRRELGRIGESYATAYLKKVGYQIIERNRRTPLGEIDIVALEKHCVVFVEVKTRTSSAFGPPYLSITNKKRIKLIQNALCYLKHKRLLNSQRRIDIVSVTLSENNKLRSIELFKNAIEDNSI